MFFITNTTIILEWGVPFSDEIFDTALVQDKIWLLRWTAKRLWCRVFLHLIEFIRILSILYGCVKISYPPHEQAAIFRDGITYLNIDWKHVYRAVVDSVENQWDYLIFLHTYKWTWQIFVLRGKLTDGLNVCVKQSYLLNNMCTITYDTVRDLNLNRDLTTGDFSHLPQKIGDGKIAKTEDGMFSYYSSISIYFCLS